MALESLDIRRRSATQTSPPDVRKRVEVAKLIDISRCIGCKACQAACMEWNDVRDDVGVHRRHATTTRSTSPTAPGR